MNDIFSRGRRKECLHAKRDFKDIAADAFVDLVGNFTSVASMRKISHNDMFIFNWCGRLLSLNGIVVIAADHVAVCASAGGDGEAHHDCEDQR